MQDLAATGDPNDHYPVDERSSVLALTASTAAATNMYTDNAFGETYSTGTSVTVEPRYQYTGREHNPKSGTDDFRYRTYCPVQAAFSSCDPLGYGDGKSLYAGYFSMGMGTNWSGTTWFWVNFAGPERDKDRLPTPRGDYQEYLKSAPTKKNKRITGGNNMGWKEDLREMDGADVEDVIACLDLIVELPDGKRENQQVKIGRPVTIDGLHVCHAQCRGPICRSTPCAGADSFQALNMALVLVRHVLHEAVNESGYRLFIGPGNDPVSLETLDSVYFADNYIHPSNKEGLEGRHAPPNQP